MPTDLETVIAAERRALMDLMDTGPYAVPNRRVDENVLLATWNIRQFGAKKSQRALQYIADICERFDIVALQEVKTDLSGLSRLQALLPGNYKILVSDPTGNNERFVFLYDKRTVISTGFVCEISFPVSADTHTGYQLHRMPYCASFRAGRFDFVMVNVHIYYGEADQGLKLRNEEIQRLVEFIDHEQRSSRSKVFDPDFFIAGDFNIPSSSDVLFATLRSRGFVMPPNMDSISTNIEQTKTYDKIAWVPRPSFHFSGMCNVVPFDRAIFKEGGMAQAKKEISDHLPLWAEFRVDALTQELDQIINPG